ncbi:MAG TPA: hypothetical protein VKR22_14815, partial [Acidimicrobiales bacterium]|nr:hypothetical protein [Acidimicrobiales bacterium]
MHLWRWRIIRGVVVLALAGAGFAVLVPQTKVDRALLSKLVISHTALPGLQGRRSVSRSVPSSESSFAATRSAAKKHPDETGIFASEWYITTSAPPEAGIVAQVLPTAATARTVAQDVDKQLSSLPTLSGETASDPKPFSVPGVAGATGYSFALADSTGSTHTAVGYAFKSAYRVGRVVITELAVSSRAALDTGPIDADIRDGAALLARVEPGFTMLRTTVPVLASAVYAAVAVVVAGASLYVPEIAAGMLERRRERHEARELRRAREQYLSRGRRTVKRQRAPAWTQSKRR